jgi:hypothetical protein
VLLPLAGGRVASGGGSGAGIEDGLGGKSRLIGSPSSDGLLELEELG